MVLVRIATIKSRVKGHHVNKSIISAKNWNANSRLKINIIIMLSWYWRRRKTKSQKEKQAKNRINGGLRFFHIPDASSLYNTPCNRFYNNYVINICPRQL